MKQRPIRLGDVLTVRFPQHAPPGREQEGSRPAIVVGLTARLGPPRFPTLLVVPLTTDKGQQWAAKAPGLYPRYAKGKAGLTADSIVLLDQLRSVDLKRIVNYRGSLSPQAYRPILEGLQAMTRFNKGVMQ